MFKFCRCSRVFEDFHAPFEQDPHKLKCGRVFLAEFEHTPLVQTFTKRLSLLLGHNTQFPHRITPEHSVHSEVLKHHCDEIDAQCQIQPPLDQ